ncbi:MAG TPA: phosphatidate cytidylyltransferase [Rhizomicrobium sp.]|nr:phosphatidate cytidylyltransferase [Rhizomicrobium sp.]
MNDTALHIIVIAATFFLAGAVAILLAGLNPAWKETVRGLWSAYRLEFAIVGAILIPAAIGGWLFIAVLLLLCWRGQSEMFELFGIKGFGLVQLGAMALGGLLVIAGALNRIEPSGALVLALVLATMCAFMQFARSRIGLAGFLSLLLPAWCVAMLAELQVSQGFIWILLVYATVEMNDAFAYVGGKLFGRTKILPRLSPHKTLEGLIAGMVVGGGSGFLIGHELLHLSAGASLKIALVALAAGLLGDVLTSLLKRWQQKKDFPALMLLHGGVLDIYDSLLIATPIVFVMRALLI